MRAGGRGEKERWTAESFREQPAEVYETISRSRSLGSWKRGEEVGVEAVMRVTLWRMAGIDMVGGG